MGTITLIALLALAYFLACLPVLLVIVFLGFILRKACGPDVRIRKALVGAVLIACFPVMDMVAFMVPGPTPILISGLRPDMLLLSIKSYSQMWFAWLSFSALPITLLLGFFVSRFVIPNKALGGDASPRCGSRPTA